MPRSSRTRMVWSPSAASVTSMTSSYGSSRPLVTSSSRRGGSHASTRPVPSHPLAKKRARNSPPRRRSPSTSPSQRARRPGSVNADHTSSISVSKRSCMRTTPVPSADRRLPRMRVPARSLLVIWCSLVRVSPGLSRCAGHPAAAPTRPGTGSAIRRPQRAARGEDCRPADRWAGARRSVGIALWRTTYRRQLFTPCQPVARRQNNPRRKLEDCRQVCRLGSCSAGGTAASS